jgi:aspartyl-tRNA(Asn)/glutamyl-tRNA(Gln) amidotransferase subunit A
MLRNMLSRRSFSLALAAAPLAAQPSVDLASLTLAQASAAIRGKRVTSEELTRACLDRIAIYNPKVNAFITVLREAALKQARAMDAELRQGKSRGALHGIPIALKDNIDTAGIRTTAASAVFDDRIPKEDAEVTARLQAAGAVLLGKLNLHEFAFGGTSVTSYFGPVRNPWNLARHPGGSSGGSAAAVSADLCYGALGTDTGGSIRTPASYCSIVGLKPTYGLVSIRGIIPLSFSRDHCGPMTKTVADAAHLLNALAGYDRLDIASVEHAKEDYVAALTQPTRQLRIGVPRAPYFDHLDSDIAQAVEAAISRLASLSASIKDVALPSTKGTTTGADVYAYHEEYFSRSSGLYQIPTRRSLQNGKDAKAADYVRGKWKLDLLRRTIDDAFTSQDIDLVVLPTRRRSPRLVEVSMRREAEEKPRNPELENPGDFNAFGIPAVSIPCGFTAAGIPIGLMIAGPRFSEGRVLALAHAFEQATDFHLKKPPLKADTPVPALAKTDED